MAIDTADKRSSIIGQGLVPLTIFPFPASGISKDDRRHHSSFYRGIDTVIVSKFRWISEMDSSSDYQCEKDFPGNYKCEKNTSSDYACEQDSSPSYKCESGSSIECLEMPDMDEE